MPETADLQTLSPVELEDLVAAILESDGFEVRRDAQVAERYHADILASHPGTGDSVVVEVKAHRSPGILDRAVQQVVAYQRAARSQRALVVLLTQPPQAQIRTVREVFDVEVWGLSDLEAQARRAGLWPPPRVDRDAPRSRAGTLRVLKLQLENFGGFRQLELELTASQSTVLVGTNGAGKTSVLWAIASMLSWFSERVVNDAGKGWAIGQNSIRAGADMARIWVDALIDDEAVRWSLVGVRMGRARTDTSQLADLHERSRALQQRRKEDPQAPLPLVVYYPVNRAVLDIPRRIRTRHDFSPLDAYDGALYAGAWNFRIFFEWFRERENLENEQRVAKAEHRDHQLEAVRQAIYALMPGFTDLRVRRSPQRMMVNKQGEDLLVEQLSDGEKCLLALVGDLARRLAIANPASETPRHGSGVVLIDEVELHLHPAWQRDLIPGLERSFPNCQFVLSTHSPQVLSHVSGESLVLLEKTKEGVIASRPSKVYGWDTNRILTVLMGVPERPASIKAELASLFAVIDDGRLDEARRIRARLAEAIGEDEPELKRADSLMRRRELLGR